MLTGKDNNMTFLTEQQVLEARRSYPKMTTVDLAKKFGTAPANIADAIEGRTWAYLPGAKKLIRFNRALGEKMGRSKLTAEHVRQIREKYPLISGPQLAKEYGVGHAMIYNIVKRKNWTHI